MFCRASFIQSDLCLQIFQTIQAVFLIYLIKTFK